MPNPEIYKLAAKRLAVKPEECIFIDDMLKNVQAAESTGMKGIVYKDFADFLTKISELI